MISRGTSRKALASYIINTTPVRIQPMKLERTPIEVADRMVLSVALVAAGFILWSVL